MEDWLKPPTKKGQNPMPSKLKLSQKPVLILLCAVQLISLLDTSIVHVALPSIQQSIDLSTHQLHWVITAYAIMCGGFMLLGGRLGDLWGYRRMLIYGMTLFTSASILAGFAFGGNVLIFARALQGLGAAIMIPSILSLITITYPEGRERNRALGYLGTVSAIGFTSGLILGGLLSDTLGWRFIFFVNIPIGMIVLVLSPRLLPESIRVRQPMDILGAIMATSAFIVFLYALSLAGHHGWLSVPMMGFILLGIVLFVLFIVIERRTKFPLVPFSIFSQRPFVGSVIASLVFGAIMGSSVFLVNLYLKNVLGYRPFIAAIALLPQEVLTMVAAFFVARFVSKIGTRWVLSAGMVSFGIGLFILTLISPSSGYVHAVLPGTLFIGLGAAMVLVSGSIAATAGIRSEQQGLASGLWNAGPQIGMSLGMTIMIAVANTRRQTLLDQVETTSLSEAFVWTSGYQYALASAIIFAGLGLCSALYLNHKQADHCEATGI